VLLGHRPIKAFLVPDSCGAKVSALMLQMATLKAIRKTFVSAIFRQFGCCFGLFDIAG